MKFINNLGHCKPWPPIEIKGNNKCQRDQFGLLMLQNYSRDYLKPKIVFNWKCVEKMMGFMIN